MRCSPKYKQVTTALRSSCPDVADMLTAAEAELTAFTGMPDLQFLLGA
jgi:hypothetical protein